MFTVNVCFIVFAGVRDTWHAVLFTLASSISAVLRTRILDTTPSRIGVGLSKISRDSLSR